MPQKNKFLPAFLFLSSGGFLFFLFLFIYGLINNSSMAYMGNTNKEVENFIFSNFTTDVIILLLKMIALSIFIFLIINLTFFLFFNFYQTIFKKNIKLVPGIILNTIFNIFVFMLFFGKNIISYPQLYMNNFYEKNKAHKIFFDFITQNINPYYLSLGQIILISLIGTIILIYIFRLKNNLTKSILFLLILISPGLFFLPSMKFPFNSENNLATSQKPNILFLGSDALRPDHLSGYGYFRKTSPNIDRLIKDGISFKNTFIEIPRTFPSWVSILTGQFSATHGIRHMFPTSRDLNKNFASLPKILKQKGYSTSVLADYAGDIFSRIDLGFDNIDVPYFNFNSLIEQTALESCPFLLPFLTNKIGLALFPALKDSANFAPPSCLAKKIINQIDSSENKPFFITTFFSATHFPYSPPYPYYQIYSDPKYEGPFKYCKQRRLNLKESQKNKITKEDIKQIRALYDGGITAFDQAVGKIINHLEEKNILENTMIIILSDHGENLYEKDLGMGHGEHFKGNFTTKIPFIIHYPKLNQKLKIKKKTISKLTRHIDITPTILSILDLPAPKTIEGKSLYPLIKGKKMKPLLAFGETGIWFDNQGEDLFFQKKRIIYPDITGLSEIDFALDNQIVLKDKYRDLINLAKSRYVFDGRYKLIYLPLKNKVVYELYDTYRDPWETKNLVKKKKKIFKRLKKRLLKWLTRHKNVIVKNNFIFPDLRY